MTTLNPHTITVRQNPRLSLKEFIDYINATSSAKRLSVLKSAKYPEPPPLSYYQTAKSALIRYKISNPNDFNEIQSCIDQQETLLNTQVLEDWERVRICNNVAAMRNFACQIKNKNLKSYSGEVCVSGPRVLNPMIVQGVELSVKPHVLSRFTANKVDYVSAIHMWIEKDSCMDADLAKLIAYLLSCYIELEGLHRLHQQVREFSPVKIQILDAFNGVSGFVFVGSKSNVKRKIQVEQTCKEIAALWPNV